MKYALVQGLKALKWFLGHMKPYPTHRERTQRTYRAYVDLVDTAKWIENELRAPRWSFDLTMGEFRLLELFYREGALTMSSVLRKRQIKRQNIMVVVKRLAKRGWIHRVWITLPPVENSRRGVGRRANVVGPSKSGKKFIAEILPNHSKLVKALMRVLDGRDPKPNLPEAARGRCGEVRQGD
jgi:DNA-binding MarR family transcriptional regulator